jgi:NTE family protein
MPVARDGTRAAEHAAMKHGAMSSLSLEAASRPRAGRALCLSGGGFRAAIFHLGALLRLHANGRLHDVDVVSSVSGGSIAAAWLAARHAAWRLAPREPFADWCARTDFLADVVEPFRAIAARDLRTWPVLATLPFNWARPSTRVRMLEARLDAIFDGLELRDLPASPLFVFCATDLTFGCNWEFSRRRCGDFQAGYLRRHGKIRLATAVAASACFPPLFGPLRLPVGAGDFLRGRQRSAGGDALRDRLELTDGGVYDNLATEPVIKRCAEVLVSDAGAPFAFAAGEHYLRRLMRYAGVVGSQAVALRKRLLFAGLRAGEFEGAYWNLADRRDAGADGYSLGLCADVLARVRTDLDGFGDAEFEVLVNHGYFSCMDGLGEVVPTAAPDWPYPGRMAEAGVRAALRHSHRRVLSRRR